jgi:hypothetical protein
LLEAKMGDNSKLAIVAFFSSIVVVENKETTTSLLSLPFSSSFYLKQRRQ